MADGTTHQNERSAAPNPDAVDLSDLQVAWSRVWASQKEQVSKAKSLAAQELKLSVKALLLSLVCVLLLVGISLLIWTTLLLTLGYAAYNLGAHWAIVATLLIMVNLMLYWFIHRIFKNAAGSIGFSTSINTLFGSQAKNSSQNL